MMPRILGAPTARCRGCAQVMIDDGRPCDGCQTLYHVECGQVLHGCLVYGCPRALHGSPPWQATRVPGSVATRPPSFALASFPPALVAGIILGLISTLLVSFWRRDTPVAPSPVEARPAARVGALAPGWEPESLKDLEEEVLPDGLRISWSGGATDHPGFLWEPDGAAPRRILPRQDGARFEVEIDWPRSPVQVGPAGTSGRYTIESEARIPLLRETMHSRALETGRARLARQRGLPAGLEPFGDRVLRSRISWLWTLRFNQLIAPELAAGRRVVAHDGDHLLGIQPDSGQVAWSVASKLEGTFAPVLDESRVFWREGGRLRVADLETGRILWERDLEGIVSMQREKEELWVVAEERRRPRLYRIDPAKGDLRGLLPLVAAPRHLIASCSTMIRAEETLVPAGDAWVTLSAIDRVRGAPDWVQYLPLGPPLLHRPVLADGMLVVPRGEEVLFLDAKDGRILDARVGLSGLAGVVPSPTAGRFHALIGGRSPCLLRLDTGPGGGDEDPVTSGSSFGLTGAPVEFAVAGSRVTVVTAGALEVLEPAAGRHYGLRGLSRPLRLHAGPDGLLVIVLEGSVGGRAGPTTLLALGIR